MAYIGELAVFEAGVAAPLDAVVGRQLPGALRLEEYDGLAEGIVVVEPAGGQRRLQGVAGEHQRREGQGDVGAHGAVLECAHGERRERPGAAGIWEHELGGEGKGRDALGFRRQGGAVAKCSAQNALLLQRSACHGRSGSSCNCN